MSARERSPRNVSKAIAPNYAQQFLLPPALEDWVGPDHPARFVREFVAQLDLRALGLASPETTTGRPAYAESLLLMIWLYGYMNRIRSARKLEAACREHMSLIWLGGMLTPDHNTLWRFWHENNKALRQLFKQSVQVAVKVGAVGMVLQALDGTKIQAVASGHTAWTKEHMTKLLAELDKQLDIAEANIAKEGPTESQSGYRLPESVAEKEALREAVKKGLEQLEQSGVGHYHRHEPEAQRMQCEGKNRFGYNAQTVVDKESGIVVAQEVVTQPNDIGQLVPMVEIAQELTASKASVTTADSGYGAGADIADAEGKGLDVTVLPMGEAKKDEPYHAANFVYNAAAQTVTCPRGEKLEFQHKRSKNGVIVETYRCRCTSCPVREQCSKDPRGREYTAWPHTPAVQKMRAKVKTPEGRGQLSLRGQVVERYFAQVKEQDGFRRWTFRGLEGVRTQWAMICCSINLRVLMKSWRKKQESLSEAFQKVRSEMKTEMKVA